MYAISKELSCHNVFVLIRLPHDVAVDLQCWQLRIYTKKLATKLIVSVYTQVY